MSEATRELRRKRHAAAHKLYGSVFNASQALTAVETWATDCFILRETAAFNVGRLDGLIVPVSWTSPMRRAGLIGLEVKVNRSDFLRGLQAEQYQRYASALSGLYVVAPLAVCKSAEIPRECGHLVVGHRDGKPLCVCKRHPKWKKAEVSVDDLWKVIWDLFDQFHKQRREELKERESFEYEIRERAGDAIQRLLFERRASA